MSRHPGYWVHELIVYYSDLVSKYLPNFLSLVFGFLSLKILHRFLIRFKAENAAFFILTCAFNPWFIIASTTTMDYTFNLFFIVLGFKLLEENRSYLSGSVFGIALMFRLGSFFTIVGSLIVSAIDKKNRLKIVIISFIIMVFIAVANYSLSFIVKSSSLNFLEAHVGSNFTYFMQIGRFFYKSIYLLGLPLIAFMAFMLPSVISNFQIKNFNNSLFFLILGGSLGNIVLFAQHPIETLYLLPLLFFLSAIFALLLHHIKQIHLILLLIAAVAPNIININIARPDVPNFATSANFGLWVEKGILILHLEERKKFSECVDAACYLKIVDG